MSIKVKPGRWRTRGGQIAIVEGRSSSGHGFWEWCGRLENDRGASWATDGRFASEEGPSDLVEFLGPLRDTPSSDSKWVPGFIKLTSGAGVTYWVQVADISQFNSGTKNGKYGSYITLRGEEEAGRFATETPDEIADLIRDNWLKCR